MDAINLNIVDDEYFLKIGYFDRRGLSKTTACMTLSRKAFPLYKTFSARGNRDK